MRIWLIALMAFAYGHAAFAAGSTCIEQAMEKKLSGAAKTSFVKKCVRQSCDSNAAEKKLSGAALASFTKKCVADEMLPYCENQARTKNLAGAARNSFMTKCQSGK